MRGRPAAAPPDLRRAAHPAEQPVVVRLAQALALGPARELGGAVVAGEQLLARVRQARALVAVDVVAPAELERVEPERRGELVHRLVEDGDALDDAGRAKRVLRAQARPDGEDHRADVLAGVERERGLLDGEHPAAGAHVDDGRELDRLQRPVAARAEGDRLTRPRPPAADDLILVTRQREPHRPARRPGELGGEERLDARSLLGAEAAADELRDHAHVLRREPEAGRELPARVEHALGRHPGRQPVAGPARDGGVRLERRLDVGGRLAGQLDEHLGACDRPVRVAADGLARILGEALLLEPGVERERGQRLEPEPERRDALGQRVTRVRRHRRDRRTRPVRLGGEDVLAAHRERAVGPSTARTPGRRGPPRRRGP